MILDSTIKRIQKPNQPDWMTVLQNDLALVTTAEAAEIWVRPEPYGGAYYNYRLEHVQQVERDALRILEHVSADEEVVLAAVWIHDRFQAQYEDTGHHHQAAEWARANLALIGFPREKVETVAFAVERHSDPPGLLPAYPLEARVLWDADKLSKLGTVSVVTYLCAHPAFPMHRVTFASMALSGMERLERARKIADGMYFEISREMAQARYAQQKAFYEALASDVAI